MRLETFCIVMLILLVLGVFLEAGNNSPCWVNSPTPEQCSSDIRPDIEE